MEQTQRSGTPAAGPGPRSASEQRPLRADARRKREAILAAAVEVFAESGVQIALDEVSRRAGVGIATLYRHFPTREDLITGAYVREVERLCDGVDELLATMPPDEAIVEWMRRTIGYVAGKPGMSIALKSIVTETDSQALHRSLQLMHATLGKLVAAAESSGTIRPGVRPDDLAAALSGFTQIGGRPGALERTDRLVAYFVDGLRHGAPRSSSPDNTPAP